MLYEINHISIAQIMRMDRQILTFRTFGAISAVGNQAIRHIIANKEAD
jgi:hypothetical protein